MTDTDNWLEKYFNNQIARLEKYFEQGWNGLRLYFDTRIAGLEKQFEAAKDGLRLYFDTRVANLEKTFSEYKATIVIEFTKVNEFREALGDVIKFQASSKSLEGAVKSLEAEIAHLKELLNAKADYEKVEAQIRAMQKSISDLENYRSKMQGMASQSSVIFLGILSIASLVISIVKLFM